MSKPTSMKRKKMNNSCFFCKREFIDHNLEDIEKCLQDFRGVKET